jgi:GLPGLI family protein
MKIYLLITLLFGLGHFSLGHFTQAQKVKNPGIEVIYNEAHKQGYSQANTPPHILNFYAKNLVVLRATQDESRYDFSEKRLRQKTNGNPLTPAEKEAFKKHAPTLGGLADEGSNLVHYQTHSLPENIHYRSFAKNLWVHTYKSSAHHYLMEEAIPNFNWEITGGVDTIANMPCRQAIYKYPNGRQIRAWFTDQIPYATGPQRYCGLPGLILKVDGLLVTIEAQKITFVEDMPKIEPPTKGERIKPEEFFKKLAEPKFSITMPNKED